MEVSYKCPICSNILRGDSAYSGQQTQCPYCMSIFNMPVFDAADMNPGLQGASSVSNVPFDVRKGRVAEMLKNFIYTYKKPLLWTFGILAFIGFIAFAFNSRGDKNVTPEHYAVEISRVLVEHKFVCIDNVAKYEAMSKDKFFNLNDEDELKMFIDLHKDILTDIRKIDIDDCPEGFVVAFKEYYRNYGDMIKMMRKLRLNLSVLKDAEDALKLDCEYAGDALKSAYKKVLKVAEIYGVSTDEFEWRKFR